MKLLKYLAIVLVFTALATALRYFGDYQANQDNCKLQGRVVNLADGDSITVLDADEEKHKVRISGIDTPERDQPYGKAAHQYLADKIYNRTVCVGWYKRDRYQRLVGSVRLNDADVGYQLVEAGLAWHYKAYQDEQSFYDRVRYAEAEDKARGKQIGLWQDPKPVPPWSWRRGER